MPLNYKIDKIHTCILRFIVVLKRTEHASFWYSILKIGVFKNCYLCANEYTC
jgi:hypothetical protein